MAHVSHERPTGSLSRAGATVYGAQFGMADLTAIYEAEISRYGGISQLDMRFK